MAMGAARSGSETLQVQVVCLDELVAAGDRYRGIERVVWWRAVRASAAAFYAADGRPSVDPVVLLKLFLVAAVEGRSSMRETLRLAERDLAVRRFLGYGLTERLPSHATVSYAQCVRFAESSVFEQLFVQVLGRCRQAGLLDGSRLVVDATHVEANAALSSLRADLALAAEGDDARAGDEPPASGAGPVLRLAEPRRGGTPKRRASNQTVVSTSDPDAKLRFQPGHRSHLVHRAQAATDPKHRVIVAVVAEHATGSEAAALPTLVRRARFAGHGVAELCADQGYASAATYQALERLGVAAYIPPQPRMQGLAALAARERVRTPLGVACAIDRMTDGEGAISELKLCHGLGRARSRGTARLQIQLLIAATAVNLKRLLAHGDAAIRAANATGASDQIAAAANAITAQPARRRLTRDRHHLIRTATRRWQAILAPSGRASLTAS
jgi:transposase